MGEKKTSEPTLEAVASNIPPSDAELPSHTMCSKKQKWNLVILVSVAAAFSPLSSNIYFPALETISHDLGVSASLTSLTITVYMIVQGIAPSLFGTLSDSCGRRLTFAISLTIYILANLALAFTKDYAMLMVLRGIQAAGSSATISISAGTIADIAFPEERGGFMGLNAGIRMMGQSIGPVIGGLLNSAWGFRSIFWLLFVMSVIILVCLLVFLPETQHNKTGQRQISLSGIHKPLAHLFEKDIAALLAWGAIAFTAWSMVAASGTSLLLLGFPEMPEWQIGLCFLPNGIGCIAGSITTGYLLDKDFRLAEAEFKERHGIALDQHQHQQQQQPIPRRAAIDFPLTHTRLRRVPLFSVVLAISLALYGPSFMLNDLRRGYGPNLVAPLLLQFLIGFTSTAIFNINSTLLIDCFPDQPASATALNNLCRCLLGAAGVSAIQPLLEAVRAMRAFLIVTGVMVAFMPLIWVEWKYGEKWRREREMRMMRRGQQVEMQYV